MTARALPEPAVRRGNYVDGAVASEDYFTAAQMQAFRSWEPSFDAMSRRQEDLARQFCAEIAGLKGERGSPPDPVRLLEMAEALYQAELQESNQ